MIRRFPYIFEIVFTIACFIIAGCAAPTTQRVKIDPALTEAEAQKQRIIVLQTWHQDEKRVADLAYSVLTKAVPLCGETVKQHIGISFMNKYTFKKDMRNAAVSLFQVSDAITINHVVKGSPAERAGLNSNDVIIAVNDWVVPVGENAPFELRDNLASLMKPNATVSIKVLRNGIEKIFTVKPEAKCDYGIMQNDENAINAFADGKNIIINRGMMRYANDNELALVISHELAHNIMKHIEARKGNRFLGALLDGLAAAFGVYTGGTFAQAGAMAYSKDFEEEADYVGLYIMALAGLDIDSAPNFWRKMAAINPRGVNYATTHPSSPHRFVFLEKTVEEIKQKIKDGKPLIPEFKKDASE